MADRLIIKADRIFTSDKGFLHNYFLVIQDTVIEEVTPHPEIKAYDKALDFTCYIVFSYCSVLC